MKTKLILFLMISIFFLSCSQKQPNPIEGTWNLIQLKWTFPDSTILEYPGNIEYCSSSWIASGNNSIWVFKYKTPNDTAFTIEFGETEYKYDGKTYQETYLSSNDDKFIGQTFSYNLRIKNDTLTLTGPAKEEQEKLGLKILEVFVKKH